ncbi:MAG: methyltransferase [Candidatus Cloacimonadales bacterium]
MGQDKIADPVKLPFGKTIYQKKGLGISSDSQLLYEAVLAADPAGNKALELGSGNGIVSIMLAAARKDWQITGLEIQPELVELSQKNAAICGLDCQFIEADLRLFSASQPYEIIFANPPYFARGKGRISPQEARAISRHELLCNLAEVLACIRRNLAATGKAWLIYPQSRLSEIMEKSKKVDLIIAERKILKQQDKIIVLLQHSTEKSKKE